MIKVNNLFDIYLAHQIVKNRVKFFMDKL